jgi:hypothetical protein
MTTYRLIRDDDCTWYVIPARKVKAFYEWVDEAYESKRKKIKPPDWAELVGEDYGDVKFEKYQIG